MLACKDPFPLASPCSIRGTEDPSAEAEARLWHEGGP